MRITNIDEKLVKSFNERRLAEIKTGLNTYLEENHISDECILDHINKFGDFMDSEAKCLNCKGLSFCTQMKKGEKYFLDPETFFLEIEYCKYKKEIRKIDDLYSSFVYNDIPKQNVSANMLNISLNDESVQGLYLLCHDIMSENRIKGLYISGDLGVGKTYMCIALANSLASKGKKVAFLKVNNFINEMRKMVTTNNEGYEKLIGRIKKCDVLFLDDIGAETVSSFSRDDVLFNILDYRMENSLTTMFTSNLSKKELEKHYVFDKNEKSSLINAKRLMERIDILSDDYVLTGSNKRRSSL